MNSLGRAVLTASRVIDRVGRTLMYAAMGTVRLDDLKADITDNWSGFYAGDADS